MADDLEPTDDPGHDLPDLADRLARLAPTIDPDAAFASLEAARSRDRSRALPLLTMAAAVLVVVVLATGVALARRTDTIAVDMGASTTTAPRPDPGTTAPGAGTTLPVAPATTTTTIAPPDTTAAPPTTTPSTTTPTTTTPTTARPTTTAPARYARADEVEVQLDLDRTTVGVGERVHLVVRVINRSAFPAVLTSDGCRLANLSLEGLPTVTQRGPFLWNRHDLVPFLAGGNSSLNFPTPTRVESVQVEHAAGCNLFARIETIAPGDTFTAPMVWDATIPPELNEVPAAVTAVAWVLVRETDLPPSSNFEGTEVVTRAELRVTDDARAHVPTAAAAAAIEANPAVRAWLDAHADCLVRVDYRRGREEYWFEGLDDVRLRVRVDPETTAILEVRELSSLAPADDGDATTVDPASEHVLFPA